jgi:hypothetical protein
MHSKLLKVVLGCTFAAAVAAPALACDFHTTSAENDQPTAQSQQTTPDAPQTAQSQPAADTGSN